MTSPLSSNNRADLAHRCHSPLPTLVVIHCCCPDGCQHGLGIIAIEVNLCVACELLSRIVRRVMGWKSLFQRNLLTIFFTVLLLSAMAQFRTTKDDKDIYIYI